MKKIFRIAFIFFLTIIISGCSTEELVATEKKAADDASSNSGAQSGQIKSSREDCITGCNAMWKSNKVNAGRSEGEMASDCNSLCDAGQGIQKQDAASCAKAEGILRDTCYGDIAKNTNDPRLCEKIEGGMLKAACYVAIVEKTGDKSLCEKITVKMMKDSCLDGVK
ncbi:MAG: hypothetical protein WC823_00020 [Parcubacteria group bacterium]|jgi:hypothetical protein